MLFLAAIDFVVFVVFVVFWLVFRVRFSFDSYMISHFLAKSSTFFTFLVIFLIFLSFMVHRVPIMPFSVHFQAFHRFQPK